MRLVEKQLPCLKLVWQKIGVMSDKDDIRQFTTELRERLVIHVGSNLTSMYGLPKIPLKLYENFSHGCECATFS